MKKSLFLLCLFPLLVQSMDRNQLDKVLATAAVAQPEVYIEIRTTIGDLGTDALPLLAQAGNDATLSWQQRLVARICYERIARSNDIVALRQHDWRAYPPYSAPQAKLVFHKNKAGKIVSSDVQPSGAKLTSIMGPQTDMGPFVVPKCRDAGLWYYFVELTWKQTGENASLKPRDPRFELAWPWWCREALTGQPEEIFLLLAIRERLQNDQELVERENFEFYKKLLKEQDAEAVSILVQRYDAFNKREVTGPELFAGRHAELYRGMFEPILSFADSRHADLLEAFIAKHLALADLKPKLTDVRARPAQVPKAEPPLRLGTTLMVIGGTQQSTK